MGQWCQLEIEDIRGLITPITRSRRSLDEDYQYLPYEYDDFPTPIRRVTSRSCCWKIKQ